MKTTNLILACAFLSAAAVNAQQATTTTTTTTREVTYGSGVISQYTPDTTFVVKETTGPVTYRYGNKVVYETKNGQVISATEVPTRVKVGTPVHVYYDMDGNARVVSRVVVDQD
ncbi:hypothetical protein [Prosthecobacter sp.]|uniref:hypothetical protein n=1 Tax=Prosthecobacter sp. TaxID=1965333 RepID=UPI0037837322